MKYILDADHNIIRIKVRQEYENLGAVEVCTILSPEDEKKSLWGLIAYDVAASQILHSYDEAKRKAFRMKLGLSA